MNRYRSRRRSAYAGILWILVITMSLMGCSGNENTNDNKADRGSESASATASPGRASADPGGGRAEEREIEWEPYEPKDDEEAVLTVMFTNESLFYGEYGNLFASRYPKVEFKVVPLSETMGDGDMLEMYKAAIERHSPDVLVMNEAQYEGLALEGKLMDLDIPIKRTKFDLDGMVPGVLDLLRDLGGGRLYGLANAFDSKVLYYNKTMFTEYGIPYPEPGMSWEEILKLAARFPKTDRGGEAIYGLFQPTFTLSPFELVQQIGRARKLRAIDVQGSSLLFGSDSWVSVFEQVIDGYRDGHIYMPNAPIFDYGNGVQGISFSGNQFIEGHAAMTVDNLLTMQMMDMGGQAPSFEWGTVTMPVDPHAPNSTTDFELPSIFAINRASPQMALAWEFVQYIHSEEYMRLISKTSMRLLARSGFDTDRKGRDLSNFYVLSPDLTRRKELVPVGFSAAFKGIVEEEMEAAIAGEKTASEAMARIQERGQETLDERRSVAEGVEVFGFGELTRAVSN